jgi:hypothetical protein
MTAGRTRADARAWLTGQGASGPAPPAVGQKFAPDGQVIGYPGNTFLCHIPPGPAHAALTRAAQRLQAGPLGRAFAFLPPASFHMTVFEGVTDRDRSGRRWPEGVDPTLPVEHVTALFAERLRGIDLPAAARIRPVTVFGGYSVQVTGATEADEAALRGARLTLRAATGIERPDFASYGFHITLAYQLRWLSADEADAVLDLSDAVTADLLAEVPEIALGGVEFCRFDDMHAFPLLARLS